MDITSNHIIRNFIKKSFTDFAEVLPLFGDASTRKYFRVARHDRSCILCVDNVLAEKEGGEYPFFVLHKILSKAGVPVPGLLDFDYDHGLILLEDLGDVLLENHCITAESDEIRDLYQQSIDIMIKIQSVRGEGEVPFGLSFDREKLNFEFDFFIEHTLKGFFRGEDYRLFNELQSRFDEISAELDCPDLFVLNHRDYHSRNIMYRSKKLSIIDFQDARMGLPQYDLVSLLLDPYNPLSADMVNHLKEYYRSRAAGAGVCSMNREEFEYYYSVMAFQRNIKAVGSYGFLSTAAGKEQFSRYIIPTLRRIDLYAGENAVIRKAWDLLKKFFLSLDLEVLS